MNPVAPIVTVHGLWNRGPESWLLRRRLRRLTGRSVAQFRYSSVRGDFGDSADRLAALLEDNGGPTDLVGHSLGGLLVLEAIRRIETARVGRVVLLASPVRGSAAARRLRSLVRGGERVIGRNAALLTEGVNLSIPPGIQVGMIAGSGGVGMGRFIGAMSGIHDGTVAVAETRMEGLADHVVLPVTHTGMLFSDAVARAVADFLRDGRFAR